MSEIHTLIYFWVGACIAVGIFANRYGRTDAIEAARSKKLQNDLDEFPGKRFGKGLIAPLKALHEAEEDRPIENVYDVMTAVTAHARSIQHQDRRVELERKAGELLKLAA